MMAVDVRRAGGLVVALAMVLGAGAARGEDPVLVNITGPLKGSVGDRVSYEVELVNRSGRNLEKLRIVDYFDSGFHHDASKSPIEMKGTIDLPVGTTRRTTLDFLLDEPGRQCHRVEVVDQSSRFVGGATECVQVAAATPVAPAPVSPPPLVAAPIPVPAATATTSAVATPPPSPAIALDLSGPLEATSGAVVQYIATIRNTGNAPSSPSTLTLTFDSALVPQEASDGYSRLPSGVAWNMPPLEAGGQTTRQLNLRAESPAGVYADSDPTKACVKADLSGLGGTLLGDQECLRIRSLTPRPRLRSPSEAGLRLGFADLDDPVRIGDATTLVCTVYNDGTAASGPLSLAVDLPRGAQPVGDLRSRIDGGRVYHDNFDVPAGGQQSFEISYRTTDTGRATASASITGANLDGRLERTCQTEFLP